MNIKKILISQSTPINQLPYDALKENFGVKIDFIPFFLIEPINSKEWRTQKINVLDYTAIVFSARQTVDAFFSLCEEMRIKIPETMKYFCTTEAVALYLQKHIVFRKRKIFFGTGTADSVIAQIGTKHNKEKFLITSSDNSNNTLFTKAFDAASLDYKTAVFVKTVLQDISKVDLSSYDMMVFYNPSDLKSLMEARKDFKSLDVKYLTFGKQIVKAMEEQGLDIAIKAPNPEAPSVARALELYLQQS